MHLPFVTTTSPVVSRSPQPLICCPLSPDSPDDGDDALGSSFNCMLYALSPLVADKDESSLNVWCEYPYFLALRMR